MAESTLSQQPQVARGILPPNWAAHTSRIFNRPKSFSTCSVVIFTLRLTTFRPISGSGNKGWWAKRFQHAHCTKLCAIVLWRFVFGGCRDWDVEGDWLWKQLQVIWPPWIYFQGDHVLRNPKLRSILRAPPGLGAWRTCPRQDPKKKGQLLTPLGNQCHALIFLLSFSLQVWWSFW